MSDATPEFRAFHQRSADSLRSALQNDDVREWEASKLREILAWHEDVVARVDAGTLKAERTDG